ncbi:MAG: SdpI family protein [Firmicutes bacterium]|nr:SdpI family protein [Bacillota bacterium]
MWEEHKGKLVVSSLLTLLPILVGLLLWNRLPEVLATHWGADGEPDGWSFKAFAVFFSPLAMLAVHYLVLFLIFHDPKNRNQGGKIVNLVFWLVPCTSLLISGMTFALALGWEFRVWRLLPAGLGVMFIAIGNYFPKCRPNYTVGIRVPWTLGSEENWTATHRFGGKVWVIGGAAMVLAALLPETPGMIVTIIAVFTLAIVPIVYSYRYYRGHPGENASDPAKNPASPAAKKLWIGLLVSGAVVLIFVAVMLFTGKIEYRFGGDSFTIEASYYDDLTVKYADIDSIEYRQGNVAGTRTFGVGSFRLLLGTFENQEFGAYTRYTYYKPESCVVLKRKGKALVLSGDSEADTRSLYETLVAKTGK